MQHAASNKVQAGPILVATDGTVAGETAFRVASSIASKLATEVRVVIVVEPLPVVAPKPSAAMQPLVASPELLDVVRDGVVARLGVIAPSGIKWQVDVEYGRPSDEIADKARDLGAGLVVIGLARHGIVDRILDGDTALEVVRQSEAPILIAAEKWKTPPMKAVAAVDFSPSSMHAARAALSLLGDGASIVLTHVRAMATVFDAPGIWEEEYDRSAESELAKFAKELEAPAGIEVRHAVLQGSPSRALLELAEREDADLITAGTRGAGFVQRVLVGSVATRLMRHTIRSLLIVPNPKE